MADQIVDGMKDIVSQSIKDYKVGEYLASQYEEPAQIIAYEYAYEIVEAVSGGQFLEQDGQNMLRKAKGQKMFGILRDKFLNENETNDEEEIIPENYRCSNYCAIF